MARLATNAKNDEDVVFVVFYDKDKNEEVMGSGRQKIRPDISEPDFFVRITDRNYGDIIPNYCFSSADFRPGFPWCKALPVRRSAFL